MIELANARYSFRRARVVETIESVGRRMAFNRRPFALIRLTWVWTCHLYTGRQLVCCDLKKQWCGWMPGWGIRLDHRHYINRLPDRLSPVFGAKSEGAARLSFCHKHAVQSNNHNPNT